MKKIILVIITAAGINMFISCGNSETKADVSGTLKKNNSDTGTGNPEAKPLDETPARSADADSPSTNIDKNNILSNIDKYLVSKVAYPNPGTVTLQNTFPDITIQKAYVEVNIIKDNGETVRTDYYIIENLEPGDSKSVKVNGATQGTRADAHIVKLKSSQLTNDELILVGSKFVPK
jgi:hypothetical protein